jgi:HSP20 family molecular chaperone IbpA
MTGSVAKRPVRREEGKALEKIGASYRKGVLTVTLPNRPEARTPARKIALE